MVRFSAMVLAAAAGCSSAPSATAAADAERACILACKANADGDLSSGPCLSDHLAGGAISPDFACDIAHEPRESIDDDPKNQCQAFRDGKVSHFVEVDATCKVIRVE